MRLLARLRDDVAQREVEVLAVVLPRVVPEHRKAGAHGVFPHGALVAEPDVERMQLGGGGRLTEAQLDATVDSKSSVETRSATRAGWFVVSCTMPWPRRMFFVRWLAAPRNTSGAELCEYSSRKWCSTSQA